MSQKKIINNCHSVINLAINSAKKSDTNFKLGAVITKGRKKIICSKPNSRMRTTYLGEISNCQHAEMAVATNFINRYVKPCQYKVSNAFL